MSFFFFFKRKTVTRAGYSSCLQMQKVVWRQ